MSESSQSLNYVGLCFTKTDSFFDSHPEYRKRVDATGLEATHHTQQAVEVCRDYFFYCTADPRLAKAVASQPSAESTLTSALKVCLDTVNAKAAAFARECRAAARTVAESLIRDLDQKDGRLPELADEVMPAMESFVDKQWQERVKALKCDIQQLWMEVMRSEDEDSMETSPRLNQPVNQAQTYDKKDSSRSSSDVTSEIISHECRFMSAKIACQIRPPVEAKVPERIAAKTVEAKVPERK